MSDAASLHSLDTKDQPASPARWWVLGALVAAILLVFVARAYLAPAGDGPVLSDLYNVVVVLGSALVLAAGYRLLTRRDWLIGAVFGLLLGLQLPFATLFQPYPFLNLVRADWLEALVRGAFTTVAAWGGLVVFHRGGPVQLRLATGTWRQALASLAAGAVLGIPLAVLNTFANAWSQGRPFQWQIPWAAALDALQPAVFEELLYRLAFLGLLWLVLQRTWPARQATWLAALLALLVHNYGHFGDEFLTQPLQTLAMGGVMALLWGLPMTVLALRRDLDSATGFHWVQDFARFWAGL